MNNNKHTFFFLWMVLLCAVVISCKKDKETGGDPDGKLPPEELEAEVHKVWDEAPYNTSADLIRFNDAFYCAFRESAEEEGSGGKVRVVKSVDGEAWETVQVFEFPALPTPTEPAEYLEFNVPLAPNASDRQYMRIPHHPDFDFERDGVFSLSAWVYRDANSESATAADLVSTAHSDAMSGGYGLITQTNNTLILDISGGARFRRFNKTAATPDPPANRIFTFGEWHHVGFVFDGPNDKVWLYQDGAKVVLHANSLSEDLTPAANANHERNNYGNDINVFTRAINKTTPTAISAASRFTQGKIRTLRFWNKVLSEAEMLSEYDAGRDAPVQASEPGLIAGYDFDFSNIGWQDGKMVVHDVKGNHPGILHNFSFVAGTPHADLQTPRLSIAPGNRLMLTMYGEYDRADGSALPMRRPYISFSEDGETFSDMVPSEVYHPTENELSNGDFRISGVTWDQTTLNAYGFDHMNPLTLFKTTNGTAFRAQRVLTGVDGSPNDVQVRFDKRNKMYVLIKRDEGDQKGVLAVSAAPYENFEYHPLDFRLHSPHFIILDDNTLVMGVREYDNTAAMHIVVTDLMGHVLKAVPVTIEQGGGYPGGIVVHDRYLWLSYSSSLSGKSDVYMAKIPLDDLKL